MVTVGAARASGGESHTVTINDPHQPDGMPMWESFDHATTDDAYRAAQAHIKTAQPDDRIVAEAPGVYSVWTADGGRPATHVATIVIAPSARHEGCGIAPPSHIEPP